MTTLSQVLDHKIVAIIRGAGPDDVIKIAAALYEGGIRVLEITLNSPSALTAIEHLSARLGKQLLIGAGTVLNAATAKEAIAAGAKFIISPTWNIETIQAAKQGGALSIPGAFTATEILAAYDHGGDIIKVFPASVGPGYIRDLRGPLPHIPLMPTGGVNLQNISTYLETGAVAVGIGSSLVDTKQELTSAYLKQLTGRAREFVQIVTNLS